MAMRPPPHAHRRLPARRLALAFALCALAGACADPRAAVGPVVVAGQDAEEPELAAHLAGLAASARGLPESGPMRGRLGMGYHANGFADAAQTSYAQAAALDPGDFRWPYLRALLLAENGDLDAALASLDGALAIDSQKPSAWLWRGTWLLDIGSDAEAEAAFRRASEVATGEIHRVAAAVGLARAHLRGDRAELAAVLLAPIVGEFDHPYPMRLLGQAYRRLGRLEDANRAAARSARAAPLAWPDPTNDAVGEHVRGFSGRLSRAEQLIDQGRPAAALAILEALRPTRPDDRVLLNNLAAAYGLTERPRAALAALNHGLGKHPDYHLFHYNVATVHEELGDAEAALRHLDRAIDAQPSFVAAHEEKVVLLVSLRRFDAALAAVNEAERVAALGPAMLFHAGVIKGADGRWEEAAGRFEQALRRDPGYAKAQLYLGRALAEARRFDAAATALDLAAGLGAPANAVTDARARLSALREGTP